MVNLAAAIADGKLELRPSLPLLLFEESGQDVVTLTDGLVAEVLAQHLAHGFHFGVHGLAISLDDIGREDEEREEEAVAVALCLPLLVGLSVGLLIVLETAAS